MEYHCPPRLVDIHPVAVQGYCATILPVSRPIRTRRNRRGHTTDFDAQAAVEPARLLQIVSPTIGRLLVSSERDFLYFSLLIPLVSLMPSVTECSTS